MKVPKACKKQLFYAHVHSRIQYGIEVYGFASTKSIKEIQTMQNRILKNWYCLQWDKPTLALHSELEVLKVCDVFKLRMVQNVYKSVNGMLPEIFSKYFQRRSDMHHHNTMHSNLLHVPRARTVLGQQTFRIKGASLYNSLPISITSKETIKAFTNAAKTFYLSSY